MQDVTDRPVVASPARQRHASVPVLGSRAQRDRAPLSFTQQRVWLLEQLDPGLPTYNVPLGLRFTGKLRVKALARALREVVRRHDALRTTFEGGDGEPVQVIAPESSVPLRVQDLGGLPAGAREGEARRLMLAQAQIPFDLRLGPLLRTELLRLADEEHVLLVTMHHIVSDAWSLGVLCREVEVLYDSFARGRSPSLPPLPIQYSDYALWQREYLEGEVLEKHLAYWREHLAGAPGLLELPSDRPRPRVQSFRGERHPVALPYRIAQPLRDLGAQEYATPFMVLLAAFNALLSRYTGAQDVVLGTVVANRTLPQTEKLIGFFANTLAMRTDLSGEPTFRELLGRVRDVALQAFANWDTPFEKIVEDLGPERSLSHNPFFQVMFVLQNIAQEAQRLDGLAVEVLIDGNRTSKFDLTLYIAANESGTSVSLEYSTDLFDAATIDRMGGHFRLLLDALVGAPDARITEVGFLSSAERSRVLEEWNATGREYPAGTCIHDLFAQQARSTPDAVAVVHGASRLTYAELERGANRLAHALRARGIRPEVRVGVCMHRTPALLSALLGILKAGGAYVPLDPAYPPERIRFMLEDAAVALVLTESVLLDVIADSGVPSLALDIECEALARQPETAPPGRAVPENLSHVIFTSGSTGRPKGVMVQHAGTVVFLRWIREIVPAREWASVLGSTSINFDVSVAEVFGTLCWGGKLVLVENVLELPSVAQAEEVRLVVTVPTAAAELLRGGAIPRSVRAFNLAGEALRPELAQALYELGHVERVRNLYGPTEDTTYSTYALVERGSGRVGIGRPIANAQSYVLDGSLQPVPVGVAGELFLAGDGLARGYARRPELTAERFVPSPYGGPGRRMYRTGDRARWWADGTLEYLGRSDAQVKIRGFRVELGEIEAALESLPGIRTALVVLREDAPGDRRLTAYVVARGAAAEAAGLRALLKARLPDFMVPSAFVVLDALPLTPSGKVDRRALPAPEWAGDTEGFVAPRTSTEEILAAIFAEVLNRERIGARDDFFASGGHSLLATRVASRVRQTFGVELPLRTLFEAPTVTRLAERIEALVREDSGIQVPPIVRVDRDRALPLSFAQQRLWFVDRLQPGRAAYNMPFAMRVRGALDLVALERALSAMASRHESLRTRFPVRDDGPVQQVDLAGLVRLPVADLARLDGNRRRVELDRLVAEEARRPFDLAVGPLLRAAVVRLEDEDAAVLFTLHHIVSDGWSMEIFVREVTALYDAFSRGEELRLPELPLQYADYAAWQRSWLSGETLEEQIGYWRDRLAGAPALLELPTDYPRPLVADDAGGSRGFTVGAQTAAGLRSLARREGATLFMMLLSAWQLLLAKYAGQGDVVVGSPIAGRNRLETEGVIGFFVNTLVLRTSLAGDPAFRELLRQVRESTLGAYQHQDLPFEKLVEELGVERSLAYTPLFQVMFTVQNNQRSELLLGGTTVESLAGGAASVKFDLTLTLTEEGEEIHGKLSYRTELWEDGTVGRMLEHYVHVLEAVSAHAERRVSEVSLVGKAERAQLLAQSIAPERAYPECLVHQLFELQAARSPKAVALVLGKESLTYGELDRRANRLARHLRGRGVGAEVRVALFLERSFEMVVGVLAILKAGGVHVPLDPTYPAERLAYQIEDSGAALLVTTRALFELLGSPTVEPVLLDAHREVIARESDSTLPCVALPENPAYITYTSGSTGLPKGAMIPHRGVVSYLTFLADEYGLTPGDVVLQRTTLSFDAAVRDLLGPLTVGARVVLVHSHEAADPVLLLRRIREHSVSAILAIVPSLLRPLLTAAEEDPGPASLRLLLVSGEPLAVADCRRARQALGSGVRVVNLWGATECTMSSSFHTVGDGEGEGAASVGVPIANTRIYVLDTEMRPVPPGVAGEAYIAGVGLARGYHERPGLTAERFLPDPFGVAPGARIYRVGDRMRRRADGRLEFVGRIDQQVKIRGIRVEAGEVETAMRACHGVRDAVVVAQETVATGTRLIAYFTGEDEPLGDGVLGSYLERMIPAYMVPSVFMQLVEIPLLPNGKVDRAALPEPSAAREDGREYEASSTATERVLVEMWEALLDVRPIGVSDNFFRLGGHSMLAVRLKTQIHRRFGVEIPLSALFEHATVRGLATRIERDPYPGPRSPLVAIQPNGDRVPIFFVHPVGGEVLCYSDLARELGPDQPFYGLQASDPTHLGDEEASIEEMAAHYVAAIREKRPAGPYLLGGWSFGGFVAFEMAQQLTRAGESVPLVAMLDTRSPRERRPGDVDESANLAELVRMEARMAGKKASLTAHELRQIEPDARIALVLEVLRGQGVVKGNVEVSWVRAFLHGSRVRMQSALRYEPSVYPGQVVLFAPSEHDTDPEHLSLREDPSSPGWAAYTSRPLLKQVVPGHHGNMLLGEHATGLARYLRAFISDSLPHV